MKNEQNKKQKNQKTKQIIAQPPKVPGADGRTRKAHQRSAIVVLPPQSPPPPPGEPEQQACQSTSQGRAGGGAPGEQGGGPLPREREGRNCDKRRVARGPQGSP